MKIREAVSSDVSRLFGLEHALFDKENFPLSKGSFYYHIKNNLLYVAESGDEIAAYILLLVKRKKAKIYSIGVSKEYRGQKIASRLLKSALSKSKEMGFREILLEVRVDNTSAIELYKKFGFEVQKREVAFYLDGCDAYIMEFRYAYKTL